MKQQQGQAAVELVLLAPLLFTILFLIFEFGRVFGSWLIITNAAREGARVAVTLPSSTSSDPTIDQRVQQTAQFLVVNAVPCANPYDSCIGITRAASGFEQLVTVMVRYKVYTLMPITGNIPFLGPINYPGYLEVVGLSTMRSE